MAPRADSGERAGIRAVAQARSRLSDRRNLGLRNAAILAPSQCLTFEDPATVVGNEVLADVIAVLWLVGMTNAFNLLDNMDGLCAGIAVIAGAAFLLGLLPIPSDDALFQARYMAALVGAVLGFLVFNVHPASIFMGDSGSLLIGMSFAGLTLGTIPGMVGKANLLSIMAAMLARFIGML